MGNPGPISISSEKLCFVDARSLFLELASEFFGRRGHVT